MIRLTAVWLCVLAVALPNVAAIGLISYNRQTARCTHWSSSERTPLPVLMYRASVLLVWLALSLGALLNALSAPPQQAADGEQCSVAQNLEECAQASRIDSVQWNRNDSRAHILDDNVIIETREHFRIDVRPELPIRNVSRNSNNSTGTQVSEQSGSNLCWAAQSAFCLVYFMGYLTLWTERLVAAADEDRLRDCEWRAILCTMRSGPLLAAYFRVLGLFVLHYCSRFSVGR